MCVFFEVRKFSLLSQPTLGGWSPVSAVGPNPNFFRLSCWTAPLAENIQYQQGAGGGGWLGAHTLRECLLMYTDNFVFCIFYISVLIEGEAGGGSMCGNEVATTQPERIVQIRPMLWLSVFSFQI